MRHHETVPYNPHVVAELRRIAAAGEGISVEFKRKASDPHRIAREMVAFANTSGGCLYVGIDDDGTIPGLKHPDGESFVIRNVLSNVHPALDWEETFIPIGNARMVIQYDIRESNRKPHYLLLDSDRSYFVRVADKTIRASRELRQIIKRRQHRKDIRFHYGDHERFLMQYLSKNRSISLREFVEVSGIKRFKASHKLVLLVLANVLHIIPGEKEDRYTLAF